MESILQTQGIHHITLNGADRKTSIDFWHGILGMPLIFEQPNLDNLSINHLYFDCGDGRTITVFTDENRVAKPFKDEMTIGSVHHIALWVSQSTIRIANDKLAEKNYASSGIKDRGFMDSIYFRDPLGLLVELSSYKFDPPSNHTHGEVLKYAHKYRVKRGARNIEDQDINAALSYLMN